MTIELVVTAGPHLGRSFSFAEHATFLVGRSSQAHFSLPGDDPHVSRLHLLVEVNPPLCRLRNMSASNGTKVNGVGVAEADLRDGDRITLGRTELTVRLPPAEPGPEAAEASTVDLPPADAPTVSAVGPSASGDLGAFGAAVLALAGHTAPPSTPTIPGYRIGRTLGEGGMGVVYAAVHLASGAAVAIKTLRTRGPASPTALTRFVRETEILRRLDHPGIVHYRDSGVAGAAVWFAMEYVPGRDAAAVAQATSPMPIGRVVGWVVQALEALTFAHDQGYVHRDVKPQNLLVAARPDGSEVVKVADFGLARAYEASPLSGLTLTGATGGTPAFMPPEQVRDLRGVTPAADQYAAAATLYRLLAGRDVYPPQPRVEQLFALILQANPELLAMHRSDVPTPLAAAIHRALSRDPATRFSDCRAFAAALKPFAG